MNNSDEILAALDEAIDATEARDVVDAVSRAFAGILRTEGKDPISAETLRLILKSFWLAEAAAREILPGWYWHERGQHGFISAYGMLLVWAEPIGSPKRLEARHPGMTLIVRIVANDLDSLAAAYALQRLSPAFPPASVLMSVQHVAVH